MALRSELAALFASRPLAHWLQRFDNVDCRVTPVLDLAEVQRHPLFTG